jgi:hypothetical protein
MHGRNPRRSINIHSSEPGELYGAQQYDRIIQHIAMCGFALTNDEAFSLGFENGKFQG